MAIRCTFAMSHCGGAPLPPRYPAAVCVRETGASAETANANGPGTALDLASAFWSGTATGTDAQYLPGRPVFNNGSEHATRTTTPRNGASAESARRAALGSKSARHEPKNRGAVRVSML